MTNARRLRIGLIGCGHISATHLTAWRGVPEAEVVALCDIDPRALARCCGEWDLPGFADVATMLAQAQVDALDICIPPAGRPAVMEAGARAGKHLLVQKPFAETLAAAEAQCALAERHGVLLAIKENWRFLPWYRAMRAAIAAGRIGELRRVRLLRACWGSPDPEWRVWREQPYFRDMARAIWFEVGVHLVDALRALCGEPSAVTMATARVSPLMKGEDCAHALFAYPGFFATCDLSWAERGRPSRPPRDEVLVEGTLGSLEIAADGSVLLRDNRGGVEALSAAVSAQDADLESHRLSQANFARAVLGIEPAETAGRDNLKTLAIVLAGYDSAEAGTTVALASGGRDGGEGPRPGTSPHTPSTSSGGACR